MCFTTQSRRGIPTASQHSSSSLEGELASKMGIGLQMKFLGHFGGFLGVGEISYLKAQFILSEFPLECFMNTVILKLDV